MIFKRLAAAALFALAATPAGLAAQATYVTPSSGPMSMTTFVSTYLNPALAAALSNNSGSSAPSVTGQPSAYQWWVDTSASPKVLKIYDGAQWLSFATIDTGAHTLGITGTSLTLGGLTASSAVATDASKNLVSIANTGSGNNVLANSPTLVTPNLGTPSAVNLSNGTALPIGGISGLGSGIGTWFATPSSTNLAAAVTDETGSGALVFGTSPTFTTPNLGTPSAVNLSNGTGLPLPGGVTGTLDLAHGGTGQGSAAAARASSGLNIDQATSHGDSDWTIASSVRTAITSASLTAARAWTLPAASAVNAGQHEVVADVAGAINGANTITITAAGSDTINGSGSAALSTQYGLIDLVSDGVSKWTYAVSSGGGGGGVSSVTIAGGTGLATSGTCAITTSGTCTLSLASIAAHSYLGNNGGSSAVPSAVTATNLGLDLAGLVAVPAQDRQNALLSCGDMSKALAVALRRIETFCDGYKGTDGINGGASSNVDTSHTSASGYVGPTSSGATLDPSNASSGVTLSNGNLTFTSISGAGYVSGVKATTSKSSGKWYFEVTVGAVGSADYIGISDTTSIAGLTNNNGFSQGYLYAATGHKETLGTDATYGSSFTVGDVIGVAVDLDNGKIFFRKGATWQNSGDPVGGTGAMATGLSGSKMPYVGGTGSASDTINLGASAFANSPPSGYTAWSVPVANNMTLVTTTQTADATVTGGRALAEIDPIDSITLNTDLVISITCNGGTNWTATTLSNVGKGQSGRTVVESADTSCSNSGTSFALKAANANNKSVNVYKLAVGMH